MRVRLVGLVVQLSLVTDDGEDLTPINIEPIHLTQAQWESFNLDNVLKEVEVKVCEN